MAIFAKTLPTMLREKKEEMERKGINLEAYTAAFNDDSNMEHNLKEIVYSDEFQRLIGIKVD